MLTRSTAEDYESALETNSSASNITKVLYPNSNHYAGKTLCLQQQYSWCAASLSDIVRRFKNDGRAFNEFSECTYPFFLISGS
jgi:glycogen phosphorylase